MKIAKSVIKNNMGSNINIKKAVNQTIAEEQKNNKKKKN